MRVILRIRRGRYEEVDINRFKDPIWFEDGRGRVGKFICECMGMGWCLYGLREVYSEEYSLMFGYTVEDRLSCEFR